MTNLLYFFFFLSGFSGLIYQVVWVRVFGNVFGNTVYSTSLVLAVFMLGLGAGSYVVGNWADRRYASRPESLLRAYAWVELIIAGLGLAISVVLPALGELSSAASSYTRDASGWFVLTATSYLVRVGLAVVLLTPITVLMGGTLTLLIRHLVRRNVEDSGWSIALLYGVNTAGAALGCFLTDFALVPTLGLRSTQVVAVALNVVAALGALFLASRATTVRLTPDTTTKGKGRSVRRQPNRESLQTDGESLQPLIFTGMALALSGFAALGMEILWFRHFSILLGAFRAVFSLLLTVILLGLGAGSLVSAALLRRGWAAGPLLILAQGLFVAGTLAGLATGDGRRIDLAVAADPSFLAASGVGFEEAQAAASGPARALAEIWFDARPILIEVALPALFLGFAFPLANALIQRVEHRVGRRAGALYLANTLGAVCGSLATGFLFLPRLGIQDSASILMSVAALAVVSLYLATRAKRDGQIAGTDRVGADLKVRPYGIAALLLVGASLAVWMALPSDFLLVRALPVVENGTLVDRSEGLTEIISVVDVPGRGRTLYTNGHPMSSTTRFSQRYMRALAHIPLLSMENPDSVLVIGFGVGNTTHAAALHPTIQRVEVADLSTGILAHAGVFRDANMDVLKNPKVSVYVNDGRHHLQMQPPGTYDLVTLEPPPIAYAGVASLYSREFYALVRSRLKPTGYISQWLPAYQVPSETTLAMIRAFIDVFPGAVLLSGAQADLLLVGRLETPIEIDPVRLVAAERRAPAVLADLTRLDLRSPGEIVGTFVGSARTLADATRESPAVTDDRPLQEYGVRSLLNVGQAVPASVVDLTRVADWCPRCFLDGAPVPLVDGLDTYLGLLDMAYRAPPADVMRARALADEHGRTIAGSVYLGAVVPESADAHNLLGIGLAGKGQMAQAIAEFETALRLNPGSAATHWHLGAALASLGLFEDALGHLRRAVELDPGNAEARNDLEVVQEQLRSGGQPPKSAPR